jgi:hypothetical protein
MFEAAQDYAPVTPSDTADLPKLTRKGLMVGTAGTLHVLDEGNQALTLTVPAGFVPLVVRRVYATGTTCSGITALFD